MHGPSDVVLQEQPDIRLCVGGDRRQRPVPGRQNPDGRVRTIGDDERHWSAGQPQ
jgi:hypothetical protein